MINKIISGGQTGVDRAALDSAINNGIEHGGWCPRGRVAEDGMIDSQYNLKETESSNYYCRTEWNVRDSDGTLILHYDHLEGGTALTSRFAKKHNKPYMLVDLRNNVDTATLLKWIKNQDISVLNIAGPRESK